VQDFSRSVRLRNTLPDCACGGFAVEDSGHSTKLATVNKMYCDYYLFDRLPQTLKNAAAVQEYLAAELGLRKSYIRVGSRLPRGGWES